MSFLSDYEPVEDRLRAFWKEHEQGRIETVLIEHADGSYVMKAMVWRDQSERMPASTGFAREIETERGVNATSALENCETSAIGRALANLGYAAKGKRPSREEMASVSATGKGGAETGSGSSLPPQAGGGEHREVVGSSSGFPVDQESCAARDHKDNRGRLNWTADGHCALCGMNKITAQESTMDDLGSA